MFINIIRMIAVVVVDVCMVVQQAVGQPKRRYVMRIKFTSLSAIMVALFAAGPVSADIIGVNGEPDATWNSNAIQLWLRADAGVETDDAGADPAENGDPVWYWRDQSTTPHDGWNNTEARRAILVDSAHNGQPALEFDGTDDYYYLGDVLDQGTDSFTIFFVFSSSTSTFPVNKRLMEKATDNDKYAVGFYRSDHPTPGLWTWYGDGVNQGGVGPVGTDYSTLFDGSPRIAVLVVDHGDTMYQSMDGATPATLDISSIGSQENSGPLCIASSSSGDYSWKGQIAEVIMYKGALTPAEQNAVGWYLQDKYAVDARYVAPSATVLAANDEPSIVWNDQALKLWLRADADAQKGVDNPAENGDPVWYWRDQTLAHHDGEHNTLTERAVLVDPLYNGHPGLRFDGIDDCYYFGDILDRGTNSLTIFCVFSSTSSPVDNGYHERLLEKADGNDKLTIAFRFSPTYGQYTYFGDGVNTGLVGPVGGNYAAVFNGAPHISATVFKDSDTAYQYIDGGTPATSSTASIGAMDNSAQFVVAGSSGGFQTWKGEIAEILIYDVAPAIIIMECKN